KANAYGHGLFEVVQGLRDQVSYFGVASIEEALALRRFKIDSPILLFGVPIMDAIDSAIQSDISIAVSSTEQAKEISDRAHTLKKPAVIHIKIDTGMGRLGIPKSKAFQAIQDIRSFGMLELEGAFTHFPQGEDETDSFTLGQIRSFQEILEKLALKGIHFAYWHAANSIGITNYKEAHFNLVRPGLTLYGLYPSASLRKKITLKSVLSWRARVILVKEIEPGHSTGYGRTFITGRRTTIGVIPVGYSHGYPFSLSNKGIVIFRNKFYPVVGRISMDYLTVDFGPEISGIKAGEIVTLLGREGNLEISAETLAERAQTIPYEIVTRLNPSISRIVL
ncbi:MAG: alanine racemase, partial [Candidatus Omnitrophica bacterium]|nr:alanine racemase [Candidatus Omnitrophota bacterium]